MSSSKVSCNEAALHDVITKVNAEQDPKNPTSQLQPDLDDALKC